MKLAALFSTLLLGVTLARSENCRYATVAATNGPATITILAGETAEILSSYYESTDTTGVTLCRPMITKDGLAIRGLPVGYALSGGILQRGTTVAGPATITQDWSGAILTVKITADTYDVNKTLILPPGTNQVYITLESSTNLVNWADATNGLYGSPDVARFFRIRMDKRN